MAFKLIDIIGLETYTEKLKGVIDTKADAADIEAAIALKADKSEVATKQDKVIEPLVIDDVTAQSVDEALIALSAKKLDKSSVDDSLSSLSTNPVQNKIIKAAIDAIIGGQTGVIYTTTMPEPPNIIDAIYGVGTSNITFYIGNSEDQTLTPLSGLVADGELSETSINPVQNKVITAALNNVVSTTEVDELFEN